MKSNGANSSVTDVNYNNNNSNNNINENTKDYEVK